MPCNTIADFVASSPIADAPFDVSLVAATAICVADPCTAADDTAGTLILSLSKHEIYGAFVKFLPWAFRPIMTMF